MTKPAYITEEMFNERVIRKRERGPQFDSRGDSALDEADEVAMGRAQADEKKSAEKDDIPVADRHHPAESTAQEFDSDEAIEVRSSRLPNVREEESSDRGR